MASFLLLACYFSFAFVSALLWYALHEFLWSPRNLQRALQVQLKTAESVLPYRFLLGSLADMKRASAGPPFCTTSGLHDIIASVFPFHMRVLSSLQNPDGGFVYWAGRHPILLVCDPEDAREVLSADVKLLKKASSTSREFQKLLGKGLPLANGQAWRRQRNLLRPAFFMDKMKEMVEDMVLCAAKLADSWKDEMQVHGAEVDVTGSVKSATADVLARTSFGSNYLQGRRVFEKQANLIKLLSQIRIQNNVVPYYRFFPTSSNRQCIKLERSIHEDLVQIIKSRRRSRLHGESKTDLLGLILDANDEDIDPITFEQVIDECKAFFFVGHETTSSLLLWTIVLLAQYPNWQARAREEVLQVCGSEAPKATNLQNLKIVSMILNEALRLYPPVPIYGLRGFKLGKKLLPAGIGFITFCLYIHTRKDIWGDDALEFNPERFRNGITNACRHPYGFIPFGIGPRSCIGQNFALMEAKVMISVILQRFHFRLSSRYRHAAKMTLTMEPKFGVQVVLEPYCL